MKYIILFLVFIILLPYSIIAQNKSITNMRSADRNVVLLNLHSPSFSYNSDGFTLTYNLPGFYNILGELNIDYKTKKNDTYYLELSLAHLIGGIHKVLIDSEYSTTYLNGGIGVFGEGGLIRVGGFTFLRKLSKTSGLEIAINGIYHDGIGYNENFPIALSLASFQTRGIVTNLTYSLNISDRFTLCLSTGYSYSGYKFAKTEHQYILNAFEYRFVSKNELEQQGLPNTASWKAFGAVTLGVAFSYHL